MSAERQLTVQINPLDWTAAEHRSKSTPKDLPTPESALEFLCAPDAPAGIKDLLERYQEIGDGPARLPVAPAHEYILERLVWPLRHARGSYLVGNFLGTISLGGLVAEGVAVLLWDAAGVQINGRAMTDKDQEALFGRPFSELRQAQRIKVLLAYGLIDAPLRQHFEEIRTRRNRYVHPGSYKHADLPKDAVAVYQAAVAVVANVVIKGFDGGKVVVNPAIAKYLERAGVLQAASE